MESIQAIYDGYTFKPIENIPVSGRYEVKIIFEKPLDMVKSVSSKSWEERISDFRSIRGILAGREINLDAERTERINRRR